MHGPSNRSRAEWSTSWVTALVLLACSGSVTGPTLEAPDGSDAGSGEPSAPDSGTPTPDAGAPTEASGEQLFVGLCSPCHGAAAEGTALGYELRHPVRPYAEWVVRNGRAGAEFENSEMLAFTEEQLSDEDLEKIFDHLDTFPQPTGGEALYLDYCRNCHGVDARGGVVGVDISEEDFDDILDQIREGSDDQNYGEREEYMPAFDEEVLSDTEVRAISDYIAEL